MELNVTCFLSSLREESHSLSHNPLALVLLALALVLSSLRAVRSPPSLSCPVIGHPPRAALVLVLVLVLVMSATGSLPDPAPLQQLLT